MKKVAIILITMISLFTTANCFAQEKDYYIFKSDDGKVTVTTVSHFGNDGKKVVIQTSILTNPTLTELSVLSIPEDAWKMISSADAGVYNSRFNEQEKVSQKQDEYITQLQKNYEDANKGKIAFQVMFWVAMAILVIVMFIYSAKDSKQKKTVAYLKRLNTEKD